MTQVIRIVDSSVINKNHYGFVFTIGSNIKKYCKDNNIKYYKCFDDNKNNNKLYIDISKVQNNKISILEQFDEQGLCKETLIYHNCFDELVADLKKQMELIECCNGNGYINEVKVLVTEDKLLDGSVLYRIGYAKVIDNDTGEDITDVFYDNYSLITNIPIINY
jgi:hypothetical protein